MSRWKEVVRRGSRNGAYGSSRTKGDPAILPGAAKGPEGEVN